MKIKASLRMQFVGNDKIAIKQDAQYTAFDSQLSIDNSLGDDTRDSMNPKRKWAQMESSM